MYYSVLSRTVIRTMNDLANTCAYKLVPCINYFVRKTLVETVKLFSSSSHPPTPNPGNAL